MNVEGKVFGWFRDHNVTALTARFIPIDFVSILKDKFKNKFNLDSKPSSSAATGSNRFNTSY